MIPSFIPTNLWPASGYCWKFWNKDRSDSIGEKLGSKIDERNGFNKQVTLSDLKESRSRRINHKLQTFVLSSFNYESGTVVKQACICKTVYTTYIYTDVPELYVDLKVEENNNF